MQPYEAVSVRGIKVNRVKSVKALKNGSELKREKKITIANMLLKNPDPIGEMAIEVPREVLDEYVTVMVMDFQ
jgi:alpha-L-fucosidase